MKTFWVIILLLVLSGCASMRYERCMYGCVMDILDQQGEPVNDIRDCQEKNILMEMNIIFCKVKCK